MSRWQDAIDAAGKLPEYMIVDGQRQSGSRAERIEVYDPGSGLSLGSVPVATIDEVDEAVQAAKRALTGPWSVLSPKDRGRMLWSIGERIRENVERLALIETLDCGKTLQDSTITVERAVDYFSYYAGIVDKLEGTTIPLGDSKVCFTERVPVGVTGHIVPWNVPISTFARGIAPTLACGNTAVVKPAEDTPLTAILLAELMQEAGLPPGVVNVVTGYGANTGQALTEHPEVRHITFTGSMNTGKAVMTAAASHVASVTLELGGKSPHLVLKDADLDRAVPDVLKGVFKNAGQICSAGTRLLVERPVHAELVSRLVDGANAYVLGHGLENPDMGPLISARQLQSVAGFAERARERGLSFCAGGNPVTVETCEGGNFFEPSIVDNVSSDDELAQSEIFGPILSVIPVNDLDHAIEVANDTAYGLAAGVHTLDVSQAMRFAKAVEAGQVFINGYHGGSDAVPFGGMKDSGIGREKGLTGLDAYSQIKAVTISM